MDGVLIIDKPAGMTSHDVIARVRRIINERRVGHTGTLDPFATGVLVVLVGRATRLAQFLSGAQKEYEALIRLGFATDTGDATGTRLENELPAGAQMPQSFSAEGIEAAMAGLRGEIEQVPPMYSAKKIAGRRLYEMARRGEEIERQPVRVTISDFVAVSHELLKQNDESVFDLRVSVTCSAGTYVRTLAEDFGLRLGIGAHLAELRRTRAGTFQIADAVALDRLDELVQTGVLISPDAALSHLPEVKLSPDDVRRVLNGIDLLVEDSDWQDGDAIRMRDGDGDLVAVGIFDRARTSVHPGVVIARDK